jgi:biofilm PGA synthesis protein PgaA
MATLSHLLKKRFSEIHLGRTFSRSSAYRFFVSLTFVIFMASTAMAQNDASTSSTTAAAPTVAPASKVPNEEKMGPPAWLVARNKAVDDARQGHYDTALPVLRDTYKQHGDDISVVRDYVSVLSWAGHDQEAVDIYQTMPAGDQPDFVLLAVGHSYRNLNRPNDALPIYQQGLQLAPDNADFAIGYVRCLLDTDQDDKALTFADEDLQKHGRRQDILLAADEAAVKMARKHDFKHPLEVLTRLHKEYPDEVGVTRDYVAVLAWSGRDADAVAAFKTLPAGEQPDYVLEAVGHSYRNLHRSSEAVPLYHQLLEHQPDSLDFAIGYGRSLSESGQSEKALAFCESDLKKHGRRKEILDTAVDAADQLARHHKYKQSLAALQRLHKRYGDDHMLKLNYMVVLGWAGRDQDAVNVYSTMPKGSLPDYALLAIGHSYRNLHRPEDAAKIYEQGLRQSPRNVDFATGLIRSLTEAGYVEKALAIADENLKKYGKRFPILLAAADAADQFGETTKALEYYEEAHAISPHNQDALHGLIRTQDRTGSPESALKLADANPGIVSASEYRHLQADNAAIMVRYATTQPEGEYGRFDATDRAIARLDALIAAWSNQGPDAQTDVQHARLDRIVAYHNRFKMQEVVSEYNDLVGEGVEIPNYVLSSVGDAYLYLHQPERARDIFLQVLQSDPNDFDTRKQLFYAYIECDDYDDAFQTIDKLASEQAPGTPRQYTADLIAGNARLYAGMVNEADARIMPLVTASPNTSSGHEALGNLYSAHGWPRKALEQYEAGVVLRGGKDVDNEIGVANTNLRLQNFKEAQAETDDLMQRYPENTQVQRLSRTEQIHNMAELRVSGGYDFRPMTERNVTGGEGYGIDTVLYSPPIDENWRIFAGEYFTHQHEPSNEGSIGYSRSMFGAEYRNGPFTVAGAPTFNSYHGSNRVGVFGEGSWYLNDYWTLAGRGELFARDTPLRALNSGTTASEVAAHATYQPDEAHSLRFGGNVMPFSDGNTRTGADASYSQRLFTSPHLAFNGLVDLGESQNSENNNRRYYNPKMDFIGLVGGRLTNILYERYSTVWQHSLTIEPGMYYERSYGESAALRMRYEHRVFLDEVFEAGVGVNFSRQAYDGSPENDVGITFDVTGRF